MNTLQVSRLLVAKKFNDTASVVENEPGVPDGRITFNNSHEFWDPAGRPFHSELSMILGQLEKGPYEAHLYKVHNSGPDQLVITNGTYIQEFVYDLVKKDPWITGTEIASASKIAAPLRVAVETTGAPGTPTSLPPQPEFPVGAEVEGHLGKFFALPGDKTQNGLLVKGLDGKVYRKVIELSPFGSREWYELVG